MNAGHINAVNPCHGQTDGERRAVIAATNISKRYGELAVLKGVSLTAREHDVITLIGSSGSGKSTFLRCLNLLEIPDAGELSIAGEAIAFKRNGQPPRPASPSQVTRLRAQTGMVFQSFNLWSHMDALTNVMTPLTHVLGLPKSEARERASQYLHKVGLGERLRYYPSHLSGGQQQRCAIARALAMEPQLLLFDEPTSALDPELIGEVLGVMRALAKEGRTMIVVTHEMKFARDVATEVLFLRDGVIEERGHPDDVFVRPQSQACRNFVHGAVH